MEDEYGDENPQSPDNAAVAAAADAVAVVVDDDDDGLVGVGRNG